MLINNFEDWAKQIEDEVVSHPSKKVILLGGASASGKSFNSKRLLNYLISKGHKCCMISADDYYKGVAQVITQYALQHLDINADFKPIVQDILSVNGTASFPQKMNPEYYCEIEKKMQKYFGENTSRFMQQLAQEHHAMNFDDPFTIDFENLHKDIERLCAGEIIPKRSYSFETSESYYDGSTVEAKDKILIVEGIYVLSDYLIDLIDPEKTVCAGTKCDEKTLLFRRLYRDIKEGRSSFGDENIIQMYLTQTMPFFRKIIQPSFKNSQFTFDTRVNSSEFDKTPRTSQVKFLINEEILQALNKVCNFEQSLKQTDYYLKADDDNSAYSVRLRAENGDAQSLTIQFAPHQSTMGRRSDNYNFTDFGNRNVVQHIKNLECAGFHIDDAINKERAIYEYKGHQFNVDYVPGVGMVLELDVTNKATYNALKEVLDFATIPHTTKPYSDLRQVFRVPFNNECEYKFKIDGDLKLSGEHQDIKQYYFNFNKYEMLLRHMFNMGDAQIEESRVRVVNGTNYVLTLKTAGNVERQEFETQIDESLAQVLLFNNTVSKVEKQRYVKENSGIKYEFDKITYPKSMMLVEVELPSKDPKFYEFITKTMQGLGIKFTDVTNNSEYKNKNIATSLGN